MCPTSARLRCFCCLRGDHLTPSELAIAAYDQAHVPKRLSILPGGHFDAYVKGFGEASGPARDWFVKYLAP